MTTTFKEKVEDFNKDGRANQITLNVRSCLQTADTIISAKFMYFPQYQLIDPIPLTLESFVYLSHIGSVGGNALVSEGKIVLSQNRPLRMRPLLKVPLLLNTSLVIPFKNMTTEYFVHRVVTDDESAVLSSPYPPEWLPAASTSCFDIHLVINIVPQKVRYTPSLFEVLKFAWIQYIAIFILFGAVIEWIERKIFDNQILATLVQDEKLRSISSFCQSTSFSSYVHAKEHPHRL
ncbi:uncharacterized protein MONOS_3838 [Monocercomonoides exilis]|uniref:uncharacterized protein n=1 Tax=Monocercomonoides exilis TaxID=2049356 RepID=UPI00355A133F|nr:hypothetical protein MONOS_3838 [Monocercomonoides exilis]|eukprot:MONOS_3838.1-p1 / transcript=MONOS_3838.1 / gene=MONOS_3838 / organism=Monocercomonoides_exilis_PA203 / gene_product=unspecified product / transcript_product=unspecified product / location=Mono_scaffold00094:95428-96560(+) / protein_length=233 / sequence_SO=supercontig / SO=protein_coding / is_pseudo=false